MPPAAPRLPPLPEEEWPEPLQRLLESAPGGTTEPMHVFTILARQPDLFRRWLGFGGALLDGRLPGRLRELVILRTAFRFDAPYEWAHHIALGRTAGVTDDELGALAGDLTGPAWDPLERAALAAVDDTAEQGAIAERTWASLAGHLDDAALVELVMLIGHYLMLSTVLRSLRVPLEPSAAAEAERAPGGPAG